MPGRLWVQSADLDPVHTVVMASDPQLNMSLMEILKCSHNVCPSIPSHFISLDPLTPINLNAPAESDILQVTQRCTSANCLVVNFHYWKKVLFLSLPQDLNHSALDLNAIFTNIISQPGR